MSLQRIKSFTIKSAIVVFLIEVVLNHNDNEKLLALFSMLIFVIGFLCFYAVLESGSDS